MNKENFNKLFQETVEKELNILNTKGKEYTQSRDVLDNFKRLAVKTDVSPLKVWSIYFSKHIDSIESFIREGKTFSDETIEGRINDARNYLMLLLALLKENKDKENLFLNLNEINQGFIDSIKCNEDDISLSLTPDFISASFVIKTDPSSPIGIQDPPDNYFIKK